MIFTFGFLLRIITLIVFFLWGCYWVITAREADQQKPKTTQTSISGRFIRQWGTLIIEAIMVLQLLGLRIFPIQGNSFLVQIVGFVLVIISISISIFARRTLGANWTHAYEYQIKKEHTLITDGIYSFVRHPIYTGLYFALIGGELVAQSYVSLLFTFLFIGGYWQSRQEEKILINHFGNAYRVYMKRSKMFIPYLW